MRFNTIFWLVAFLLFAVQLTKIEPPPIPHYCQVKVVKIVDNKCAVRISGRLFGVRQECSTIEYYHNDTDSENQSCSDRDFVPCFNYGQCFLFSETEDLTYYILRYFLIWIAYGIIFGATAATLKLAQRRAVNRIPEQRPINDMARMINPQINQPRRPYISPYKKVE
jgi:hypothetical protein